MTQKPKPPRPPKPPAPPPTEPSAEAAQQELQCPLRVFEERRRQVLGRLESEGAVSIATASGLDGDCAPQ
jgi:hypothetical protein